MPKARTQLHRRPAVMTPRSSATTGRSGRSALQRREQRLPRRRAPATLARGRALRPAPPSRRPVRESDRCEPGRSVAAAAPGACARTRSWSRLRLLPVIQRIAPELTVGREIIRRHAGQQRGPALRIELELLGLRPGGRPSRARRRSAGRRTGKRRARARSGATHATASRNTTARGGAARVRRPARARPLPAPRGSRERSSPGHSHQGRCETLAPGSRTAHSPRASWRPPARNDS